MNGFWVGVITGLLVGGFGGALLYHICWRDCFLDAWIERRLDTWAPLPLMGA